jgi:hypothetical protein
VPGIIPGTMPEAKPYPMMTVSPLRNGSELFVPFVYLLSS